MLDLVFTIFGFSFKIMVLYVFLSLFNVSKVIKIDNLINESFSQDNQDFSRYKQNHKFIALYYSDTNNNINNYYKLNKNINFINDKMIEEQIKLAKSHGIYGFGIVYDIIYGMKLNEEVLNLFSSENMNNFPFLFQMF